MSSDTTEPSYKNILLSYHIKKQCNATPSSYNHSSQLLWDATRPELRVDMVPGLKAPGSGAEYETRTRCVVVLSDMQNF